MYLFTSVNLPEVWAYNGDENKECGNVCYDTG
jgi:hypothetical protein